LYPVYHAIYKYKPNIPLEAKNLKKLNDLETYKISFKTLGFCQSLTAKDDPRPVGRRSTRNNRLRNAFVVAAISGHG